MTFLINFYQFMNIHGMEWKKKYLYVGFCSDGAGAMTGNHSEGVAQIKEIAPYSKFVHCSFIHSCIHCKALSCEETVSSFKDTFDWSSESLNSITSRAMNSRLLLFLCSELGSKHDTLLHTEVRWLSQGSVINIMLPSISCCIK
jgi:hypothetical protein